MLAWLFVSLVEGNRCVSVGPRTRHLDASFFSADGVMVEPQPWRADRTGGSGSWLNRGAMTYLSLVSLLGHHFERRVLPNTSEGRGRSDPEIPVAAKIKN